MHRPIGNSHKLCNHAVGQARGALEAPPGLWTNDLGLEPGDPCYCPACCSCATSIAFAGAASVTELFQRSNVILPPPEPVLAIWTG